MFYYYEILDILFRLILDNADLLLYFIAK